VFVSVSRLCYVRACVYACLVSFTSSLPSLLFSLFPLKWIKRNRKKNKNKNKFFKNRNVRKTTNIKPNNTHTYTHTHAHRDKDETRHRRPCMRNRQDNILFGSAEDFGVGWCLYVGLLLRFTLGLKKHRNTTRKTVSMGWVKLRSDKTTSPPPVQGTNWGLAQDLRGCTVIIAEVSIWGHLNLETLYIL
jgi:hypothetical protein